MSDLREITFLDLVHPEYIDGGAWQRVDHPVLAPIAAGIAELGWEGDSRLVVYLNLEHSTFVLWRLEGDGEYRAIASIEGTINEANVNSLCARLVEIDTRRGFDCYADVMAAEDAKDAARTDRINEIALAFSDKLRFGLARSHLPGVDVSKRVFTGFGG